MTFPSYSSSLSSPYNGRRRPAQQAWNPGDIVKAGFLTNLKVLAETISGHGNPKRYLLQSAKGQYFQFTPHAGLMSISREDAEVLFIGCAGKIAVEFAKGLHNTSVEYQLSNSQPCWADGPGSMGFSDYPERARA